MGLIPGGESGDMSIAEIHPAPAATPPDASLLWWIVLAVVLAVVVISGLVIASRR